MPGTSDIPSVEVLEVAGEQLRNGKTIYRIKLSDGETYSTFRPELSTKAYSLLRQTVSARVTHKENWKDGTKFDNYYLEDVAPVGQLPSSTVPPVLQGAVGGIPMVTSSNGMAPDREKKIVRQNVFGTAHNFVAQLFQGAGPEAFEEATKLAQDYARELFAQVMGTAGGADSVFEPTQTSEPVPALNTETNETTRGPEW